MLIKIEENSYTKIIQDSLSEYREQESAPSVKPDGTLVTSVDLKISKEFKKLLFLKEPELKISFYCEEDGGELSFPSYVLDPVDGTRGFVEGNGEWVVSLAYMNSSNLSDGQNQGLLINPDEGLRIESWNLEVRNVGQNRHKKLVGAVSRSDFSKSQALSLQNEKVKIVQKGSIALKLGLLALGKFDFVFSRTPKNIWDISAGTIICKQAGLDLYNKYGKVKELSRTLEEGPMLWCHNKDLKSLSYLLEF